jgi:hypothetical protein
MGFFMEGIHAKKERCNTPASFWLEPGTSQRKFGMLKGGHAMGDWQRLEKKPPAGVG